MDRHDTAFFVVALAAFIALFLGISESRRADLSEAQKPRLVAFGCEGTPGYALYANEEDHFPKCLVIEENK